MKISYKLLLFSLLSISACSNSSAKQDLQIPCRLDSSSRILAIGDSLTAGFGAPSKRGYPEKLSATLQLPVYNLGKNGEVTGQLLSRIDSAIQSTKPSLILITIGGNDFLRKVDRALVWKHLHEIALATKKYEVPVAFFGIPSGLTVTGLSDDIFFKEMTKHQKVGLIPDVVSYVLLRPSLKSDQIHPNEQGYSLMAEQAAQFIRANCLIR